MIDGESTRCLLLTPPGTGAIGVIRLIGSGAAPIVEQIFLPGQRPSRGEPPTRRSAGGDMPPGWAAAPTDRARYGRVVEDGIELDDAVMSYLSILGKPAFDICVHGGVRVVERVLGLLERNGAEVADPRDLDAEVWASSNFIEHEAIGALVSAKTARAVRLIAWQRRHLPGCLSDLAARAATDAEGTRVEWDAILFTYEAARLIIHGATVALVGPPNSGKSTLFNRLVGRDAALASPIAGTTRDWVTADVEVHGVPVTLIDTAGAHETVDGLEQEAIAGGRSLAESTDLTVLVLDGAEAPTDNEAALVGWAMLRPRVVVAVNKTDRRSPVGADSRRRLGLRADVPVVSVSALEQTGLNELTDGVLTALGLGPRDVDRRPALFTERLLEAGRAVATGPPSDPLSFSESLRQMLLAPWRRSAQTDRL